MREPVEKVETRVETDQDGVTRYVEQHTRPWQNGQSNSLLIRTSRPMRDDETCEQAAADSKAFREDFSPEEHVGRMHILFSGPSGLGKISAYSTKYADGSSSWQSFARPEPTGADEGAQGSAKTISEIGDEPRHNEARRHQSRRRRKNDRIEKRRRCDEVGGDGGE